MRTSLKKKLKRAWKDPRTWLLWKMGETPSNCTMKRVKLFKEGDPPIYLGKYTVNFEVSAR